MFNLCSGLRLRCIFVMIEGVCLVEVLVSSCVVQISIFHSSKILGRAQHFIFICDEFYIMKEIFYFLINHSSLSSLILLDTSFLHFLKVQ